MMKFVSDREENIVGKGENAGYQHFLIFPKSFQRASLSGMLKVVIVWLTHSHTMTPFDAPGKQTF